MKTKRESAESKRAREVRDGVMDEISRFNIRVRQLADAGTPLIIPDTGGNLNAGLEVQYVDSSFWLHTGRGLSSFSWAYCNDYRWERLLAYAGVRRARIFEK